MSGILARPQGNHGHAVLDRDVRIELSNLHFHHVGHGVSCWCQPVWAFDFDHGDRLDHRRATCRPARETEHCAYFCAGTAIFGFGFSLAAVMPNYWLFGLALIVIGISAQTITTSTISLVQLSTEPNMRGQVMAILLAIALGGTPVGAPILGWVADTFGPRWALGVGAAAGIGAAMVGLRYLWKVRCLRPRADAARP